MNKVRLLDCHISIQKNVCNEILAEMPKYVQEKYSLADFTKLVTEANFIEIGFDGAEIVKEYQKEFNALFPKPEKEKKVVMGAKKETTKEETTKKVDAKKK